MPRELRTTWEAGDKLNIAKLAEISPGHLSDILHGRRTPSADMASKVAEAASALGIKLSRGDLLYRSESTNPLVQT